MGKKISVLKKLNPILREADKTGDYTLYNEAIY